MKTKLGLIIALGLGLASASAFAHDENENRGDYSSARHGGLEYHVNHVNGMLSHVRSQLRRYGADLRVRREVEHISGEVNRVNWKFRHGDYNRGSLRREIEHIHAELHAVEERLHVRAGDYYRWN